MTDRRGICRWRSLAVIATVMVLTAMACARQEPSAAAATSADQESPNPTVLAGSDILVEPTPGAEAVTYNPALAPAGATILTSVRSAGYDHSQVVVTISVAGFLPNRGYAVHAHTQPCGATGGDAGPHYQNRIDPAATPEAPSTNPEYANPRNEFWLDVRTNATGSGSSRTTVPFGFTDRVPRSIVVHEAMTTATAPGQAGQAGDRIACVTLARQ
ncbi:MAG: superoxide dismutase [Pseudonocardiaceae bacterium]